MGIRGKTMHAHTKTTTFRAMRIATAMLGIAAIVTLAGCSGADSEASPSASATASASPAPTASETLAAPSEAEAAIEQLAAALPTVDQVEGAVGDGLYCPGSEECGTVEGDGRLVSVMYLLTPSSELSEEEAEQVKADSWIYANASVSAQLFDTEEQLAASHTRWLDDIAANDGPVDSQVQDLGDGAYTPGFRGEGSSETLEINGWTGAISSRQAAFVGLEGKVSPDTFSTAAVVAQGLQQVSVLITVDAAGNDLDDVVAQTKQLIEEYLERLG